MQLYRTVIWVMILSLVSLAQFQSYINLDQSYESNPFRYPEAQESWISAIEGAAQYNFTPLTISYTGNYTFFSNFSERNYYWHQAALFSTWENTRAGVYFDQRLNSADYSIYDYYSLTAYLNHSFTWNTVNMYFAGNAVLNTYSELSDLDNYELHSTLRLNKSFQTRTTLIGGIGIHYKSYTTTYTFVDTLNYYHSGMGPGGNTMDSEARIQNVEVEAPTVSQIQYWMRIAQSLADNSGLALQYNARLSLSGSTRYLAGLPYEYFDESDIFDDPMGYELQSLGLEFTQLLQPSLTMKASVYAGQKEYTSQGIYLDELNFDESTLRSDQYMTARLGLIKNVSLGNTGLSFLLEYQWLQNESNSFWYNYTNHYTNFSISFSF